LKSPLDSKRVTLPAHYSTWVGSLKATGSPRHRSREFQLHRPHCRKEKTRKSERKISEVKTTRHKLKGSAGLTLFVAHWPRIELFALADRFSTPSEKHKKGLSFFY